MTETIDRIELIGRVGADPEIRYIHGGVAVAQLPLEADRRPQDEDTDWHTIVCWDQLAEAVREYVRKGDRLYVAGSLARRVTEGLGGQCRYATEVHATEVVFPHRARGRISIPKRREAGQD